MTPAEIARRLTPAMRESLLRRPCPSWYDGPPACLPLNLNTEAALGRRGLLAPSRSNARPFTPLGQQVRAIVAAEEQRDE